MKSSATCLVLLSLALLVGCLPGSVKKQGIVAWNYESVADSRGADDERRNVRVRVDHLEYSSPAYDVGMPGGALRPIPIASLFSSPLVWSNSYPSDWGAKVARKHDEAEKILVEELDNAALFSAVGLGDGAADYVIQGKVELRYEMKRHTSGLGVLYIGILPAFFAPIDKITFIGQAHLEIVSSDGSSKIWAEDYSARSTHQIWPFYNQRRMWKGFGEEVYPRIVKDFLTDVKALPASVWRAR